MGRPRYVCFEIFDWPAEYIEDTEIASKGLDVDTIDRRYIRNAKIFANEDLSNRMVRDELRGGNSQ